MPAPTMQARVSTECRAPRLERVDQLDAKYWVKNSPLPDSAESAPTNPLDRAYAVLPDADDLKDELQEYFALGQQSDAQHDPFHTAGTMVFTTPPRPATLHDLPVTSPLDRAYAILPNAEEVQEEMEEYLALGRQHQSLAQQEPLAARRTSAFDTAPGRATPPSLHLTNLLNQSSATLQHIEELRNKLFSDMALLRANLADEVQASAARTTEIRTPPR